MTPIEPPDPLPAAAPPASAPDPGAPAHPTSWLLAVGLGFSIAAQRLKARRSAFTLALGLALTLAAAAVELSVTSAGAIDRTLSATFRLIVPLVTLALAADAAARDRLSAAAWPAARFGAPRRAVALGITAAAALACAAASALLALTAVLTSHAPGAPPLLRDALTCAWIGALAGAAYAGWYSLASTFLRRGRARLVPLLADLFLGGTAGIAAALFPRSHAINLLGGPAPLSLPPQSSAALLALTALTLALAAALRSAD
ncbi:MAG: hypothetical protein IT372_04980 [Polyangiaceae bacterium]|nr:hypothetical protein [Polyangiaceae bacterium]